MLGYPKQEIVYGEGYVSAKNGYQMDTVFCQLSTTANEGNSGSPVLSKNGELVGIVTSHQTNATRILLAITSANIYWAMSEIKKQEKIIQKHSNSLNSQLIKREKFFLSLIFISVK